MLTTLSQRGVLWLIFAVMLIVIVAAWVFEFAGYPPCDLCLKQRWAYYAVVPLAGLLALISPSGGKAGLGLVFVILVGSAVFGAYHAGIEWKFWEGPSTCAGGALSGGLPDLAAPVASCGDAALRILGLSLAGWNAVISAVMAVLAFSGIRNAQ
jgi:disulfide bond formation protein DsbB